ncbi:MAG: hypothetical protein M1837_005882 [Sclerophora amabilis]|nr:MAG: hypothetical protein M1837_005882 [Sclerophora amabilis]
MGDSQSDGRPSIPQWQRKSLPDAASTSEKDDSGEGTRAELISQASKFLDDDDIRNASSERKKAFLESKGLRSEEIEGLLDSSSNKKDSANTHSDDVDSKPEPPAHIETPNPPQASARDAPPIITYPEFLVQQSPTATSPPLITGPLILNSLYVAAGALAAIYGTSTYLVSPMIDSLTSARHSLASKTLSNLSDLNAKLENAVSELPASTLQPRSLSHPPDSYHDEDSDSDPTELFHVDTGTQTSPGLSRRGSTTPGSLSGPTTTTKPDKDAQLTGQESRLKVIQSHLSELLEDSNDVGTSDAAVTSNMLDFSTYLSGLAYSSPYYATSNGIVGATSGAGLGRGSGSRGTSADEDVMAKVKSEIRGIKGVLLSARNFPGSVGTGRVRAS